MSCHFFAVFVKMKDSRSAEEFVSASPILMGRIRMLDVLASFGQKMSAIFSRTIWPQAMLQNENTITAFTFVASSLIQNPILSFELSRKILFLTFEIVFWHSKLVGKSYFHIRTENPILTFKILFWHSHWVGKSYFDIQNPILTFNWVGKSYFDIQNPILTFELSQ